MTAVGELAKLPAFIRRDLRIAASYRTATVSGLLASAFQAIVFSFIGKLVDPSRLPEFGTTRASYLEFVIIGVGINMIVALLIHQLATAIRNEQLMGTLESLLTTPTSLLTTQVGSAAFPLVYIPLRIGVFVALIAAMFGLGFHASGMLPALAILTGLIPFLWGLGLLSGGAVLTFRRGAGAVTLGGTVLGLASGAFFPLSLLPSWLQVVARQNPLAIAIHGVREALIGGTGWTAVGGDLLKLVPLAAVVMLIGTIAFRLALARERRNGTLGLY